MAVSHQSVDWYSYFKSIRHECPWAFTAYVHGEIHIIEYQGHVLPLGKYQARVYVVNSTAESLEALCQSLDHGQDEWLFSYPGYGPFAAPVCILIQQDRARLKELRSKLNGE